VVSKVVWLGSIPVQDFDHFLGLVRPLPAILIADSIDRLFAISLQRSPSAATTGRLAAARAQGNLNTIPLSRIGALAIISIDIKREANEASAV
jgi:hypothetical protein